MDSLFIRDPCGTLVSSPPFLPYKIIFNPFWPSSTHHHGFYRLTALCMRGSPKPLQGCFWIEPSQTEIDHFLFWQEEKNGSFQGFFRGCICGSCFYFGCLAGCCSGPVLCCRPCPNERRFVLSLSFRFVTSTWQFIYLLFDCGGDTVTSIDQGIAYVLMLVALALTYLIHAADLYFTFWACKFRRLKWGCDILFVIYRERRMDDA